MGQNPGIYLQPQKYWPTKIGTNSFWPSVVFDNHIQINFGTQAKCTIQKHNAHCNQLELWLIWGSRHTTNSSGSVSPTQLLLIPVSWGSRLLIVGCSRGGGGAVEILRYAIGIMGSTAHPISWLLVEKNYRKYWFLVLGVEAAYTARSQWLQSQTSSEVEVPSNPSLQVF